MLPQKYRLTNKRDFDRVHQKGKFFRQQFTALKLYHHGSGESRVGIIVSNKISKKAVVRNKIKRWIRASILHFIKQVKPGYDIVIMVRPEITEKNFSAIDEAMQYLFIESGLMEKNND